MTMVAKFANAMTHLSHVRYWIAKADVQMVTVKITAVRERRYFLPGRDDGNVSRLSDVLMRRRANPSSGRWEWMYSDDMQFEL